MSFDLAFTTILNLSNNDSMSSPANADTFAYHVLNFFHDIDDNCALTVLINNVRFHVIAETSSVKHGKIGQEYAKLLQAVKEAPFEDDDDDTTSISSDSGIDVKNESEINQKDRASCEKVADQALQQWMLSPLARDMERHAPGSASSGQLSLEEWYNAPTHSYSLEAENRELHAVELEADDDLHRRIRKLLPEISLPKYIRELDVPWYEASDITVLCGSNFPPPYHPAHVQVRGSSDLAFLKLVDPGQPQATKREIFILHRIAQEGLHGQIRCPELKGLVTFGDDHSKIMGFLQTEIPNPVPLTLKLDTEVPQELRDGWAAETQRVIDVLHEHDIVWGDAKADNFMVDENDELWIIDFGGSYTEGWVDPKLVESMEGDDMGVEKIANALHDPEANTFDPDVGKSFGGDLAGGNEGRKRKAEHDQEPDAAAKKQRRSSTADGALFCYCDKPSAGRMVACDGEECEREWFHFGCVGMSDPPSGDEEWYCRDCKAVE